MKKLIALLAVITLTGCSLMQQSPEDNNLNEESNQSSETGTQNEPDNSETTSELTIIDTIESQIANATITTKELEGFSTEGTVATYYELADEVLKIKATHYGETGHNVNQLYLQNQELVAAIIERHSYNTHIIDPEFDETQTTVQTETFIGDEIDNAAQDHRLEAQELLHIYFEPAFPQENTLQTYQKDFFSVSYPSTFMIQTAADDYGKLISTDDTVIIELYSPLWSGEPTNLLQRSNEDEIATKTVTSTQPGFGDGTTVTTTWKTFEAKDGLYTRSIEDKLFTYDDDSETRYTWSIQYKTPEAYDLHKSDYLIVKGSLIQYADH